ncbi:hypothetical protein Rhopal_007069-T1 [Rhodotorula paludigena]|uniref:FHA domain-containing protein n=1 Tax=Rhodotorula paludigena TaxID=86838 RepID=A0AAV5GN46_9BASI|nr:hypothetical protein Rhopal_007069-T1 [Rhodotorula paludigena]
MASPAPPPSAPAPSAEQDAQLDQPPPTPTPSNPGPRPRQAHGSVAPTAPDSSHQQHQQQQQQPQHSADAGLGRSGTVLGIKRAGAQHGAAQGQGQGQQQQQQQGQQPQGQRAFQTAVARAQTGPQDDGFLPKPMRRLNPDNRPGPPSSLTPAQPAPPATSTSAPGGAQSQIPAFPALHLTPLNGTFVPKQISLDPPGARVKIGRQTNAKTIPNGTNGYFDSKVLSRAHAEVWSEDGKVFIKDVKSSNGTFINGERLSPESSESDVFELHTDDVVEFGIDILTDDTKTIVHHKVAAKVHLVLNPEDAVASTREINNWYRSAGEQSLGPRHVQRAPRAAQGQNGLSFEHVLSRLQGELQKSRDTGANLGDVNSTLNIVHDTLGGGAPPTLPAHLRPSAGSMGATSRAASDAHAQSIAALQQQLSETQQSLAGHVEKIRDLEGLLAEHETIRREVGTLREQMEEARESMSGLLRERERDERQRRGVSTTNGRESPLAALLEREDDEEDDGDDAASIASVDTVVNGKHKAREEAREPDDDEPVAALRETTSTPPPEKPASTTAQDERERLLHEQNAKLVARLEALTVSLDEATQLGAQLRTQHAQASETIKALEERVHSLEEAVDRRVAEAEGRVEQRWETWRAQWEKSWRSEREGWEQERDKLRELVRDWEERRQAAEASAARSDDDGDSSDGDEDCEEGSPASGDEGAAAAVASSAVHSVGGKKRSTRRRKRSSLTPVPPTPSSSFAPASAPASRASKLAQSLSAGGDGMSDSDSTIGELSGRLHQGAGASGSPSESAAGVHGGDGVQVRFAFKLALAAALAAVVVIAVAVGYGAAMKLKE